MSIFPLTLRAGAHRQRRHETVLLRPRFVFGVEALPDGNVRESPDRFPFQLRHFRGTGRLVKEADPVLARRVIAVLSAIVVVAVAVVLFVLPHPAVPTSGGPDVLATVNAALNAGATVCLLAGYFFIRAKRIALHRAAMSTAFVLSSVFLVTYLVHHARVGSVPFRGTGLVRFVYFAVLIPHVILAVVIVPMALATLYRGLTLDVPRHRPLARRTLPIWLYVSASGVLVYFLLYHFS